MSWYNNDNGFASLEPKKTYTKRFWMPNNQEKLITFVDTPVIDLDGVQIKTPFQYNEYQLQLNGNWRNWFTQPINPQDDVLKEMGYKASKVAVMTIVDHSEWTDKQGNLHKDELSLYVVKRSQPIWKQIEKLIERNGSLAGKTFRVHRMGDKSPGSGSMLEKNEQDFNLDPNVHKPFNYLEILKPKTRAELEAIFNPNQDDPFKRNAEQFNTPDQQVNDAWSNQSQSSWSTQSQSQAQANGWGNHQPQQEQNRVLGANSSSDSIPF